MGLEYTRGGWLVALLVALFTACDETGPIPPPGDDDDAVDDDVADGGPADDDAADDDSAVDPPLVVLQCAHDPAVDPDDLPPLYVNHRDRPYRVVAIDSDRFDELYALVTMPKTDATLYDDGAPLVVAAPPAHQVSQRWTEDPGFYIPAEYGVVEVLPVWPGWEVQGHETTGPTDHGGLEAAAALAEVFAWASSGQPCATGQTLSQITDGPVCHDPAVLLASSTGGLPAMGALHEHVADLAGHVLGFAGFENPTQAQFATAEAGAIWMDPDDEVDGDGDGYAWDDGRNLSFDAESCAAGVCTVDYASLAWTDEVSLSDVLLVGDGTGEYPPGLLYLDRDGSGRFDLDEDGRPDLDGNGVVDLGEDTFFKPQVHIVDATRYAYSPQALEAAVAAGVLAEGTWPDLLDSEAATATFWAERTMFDRVGAVAGAYGEAFRVAVLYSEVPHGPAYPSRPNTRQLHDAFLGAGVATRYNGSPEAVACLHQVESLEGYTGGPPAGTVLTGAEMPAWSVPEELTDPYLRVPGTLGLFWDAVGPFAACDP